jgi:TPR repeat protein
MEAKMTNRTFKAAVAALIVAASFSAGSVAAGPQDDVDAIITALEKGDSATAVRLLRPFAEHGNATAQFNLGFMYYEGQGVPQDYATAMSWFRKAADQGDANAQNQLAIMYNKGQGVPQDYATAVSWYRKAAEQGDTAAQYNLGAMYNNGQGVPQDYVAAHMWFNLAAAGRDKLAVEGRERAVEGRERVAKEMTPAQIAEAQKLAREWKPK